MRGSILALTGLLAGALTGSASITVQAWYHLGEPGTLASGLPVDSSGNGNNMNDGFSEFETVYSNPNTPGGPLGTSGWTSTESSEWGRNGDVIIAARDGYYVSGDNFGIEAWVLPYGNGYNVFCCENAHNYTAQIFASGADETGFYLGVKNNQDGTYSFVATVITDTNGVAQVGDSLPLVTNAWTHLAVVRNNGTNTFYVNGLPHGAATTDTPSTNAPSGTASQDGMRLGASGGDQVAYRGLIDEARAFTFNPGEFSVTNLLYPSASSTTPLVVAQPTNTTAWDGGAVPFSVQLASAPSLIYQWQRDQVSISAATSPTLFLPSVSFAADNGRSYRCLITNTASGGYTISSNALLTVVQVQSNNVANYHNLITAGPGLVAYFPVDFDRGSNLDNLKAPAGTGTLEGNATYDSRTDRSFGQRALALDRSGNLGDVMLANNPDYFFPGGAGTFEAVVFMSDLGAYINASGWSFPTIFSIGDADRTTPQFNTLIGVSKVGDALEYSDGSTTLAWNVPKNLLGRFAHVALVFDQSSGITAYADGHSLGTQGTFSAINSPSPAWIGSAGSYTNSFTGPVWSGTIDEVAIYTNALSASTIDAHYSMLTYGTNTPPVILTPPNPVTILAGAADRTAIFSVDAEGTFPLGYQWSSNGVPITGATSNVLTILNSTPSYSATYSVVITNSAGTTNVSTTLAVVSPTGYVAAVTADNPLSYWRLDERGGTSALDSWGTNTGKYLPGVTYSLPGAIAGDTDTSVAFDGVSGEMEVPYSAALNPSGPFSVEAWVKPLESPPAINPAGVLASLNFNSGRSGWLLYQFNSGWNLRMGDTTGYTFNQSGATVIQSNAWYYLVVVYDGANATLYVNGSVDTTGAVSSFNPNNSAPFEVGAASGVGRFVKAQVDEVAFYNTALSATRIQAHYAAANAARPPKITFTRSAGNIILSWPSGVLYQADDLTATFTKVTGASSPYTVTPSGARKFYLLQAQ